jgi:hypothetical protein
MGKKKPNGCPVKLSLYGFISTSTSLSSLVSFANPDLSLNKYATVYHIHWKEGLRSCWYFDDSAYPDEKEVLIGFGYKFLVLSVDKIIQGILILVQRFAGSRERSSFIWWTILYRGYG